MSILVGRAELKVFNSTEEWLKERSKLVLTGTGYYDLVNGRDPRQKFVPKDNIAMKMGRALEPVLRQESATILGQSIRNYENSLVYFPEDRRIGGSLDGWFYDGIDLVIWEGKTTNSWDTPPQRYIYQVKFYIWLTGAKRGVISSLRLDTREIRHHDVSLDDFERKEIGEKVAEFLDSIDRGVDDIPVDSKEEINIDTGSQIDQEEDYVDVNTEILLDEEWSQIVEEIRKLSAQKSAIEKKEKEYRDKLKSFLLQSHAGKAISQNGVRVKLNCKDKYSYDIPDYIAEQYARYDGKVYSLIFERRQK